MRLDVIQATIAPSHEARLEALLETLIDEVRQLRVEMLEHQGRRTLSRADRATLEQLLPPIAGALDSELFLASDLFEHPSAALRLAIRALTPKKVGRLFKRGAGYAVGGYVVRSDGIEAGAHLWRVTRTLLDFSGR